MLDWPIQRRLSAAPRSGLETLTSGKLFLASCSQSTCGAAGRQAEDEVILGFIGQGVLAFLPVRHGAAQRLPKLRPVMTFNQVNELVHEVGE